MISDFQSSLSANRIHRKHFLLTGGITKIKNSEEHRLIVLHQAAVHRIADHRFFRIRKNRSVLFAIKKNADLSNTTKKKMKNSESHLRIGKTKFSIKGWHNTLRIMKSKNLIPSQIRRATIKI